MSALKGLERLGDRLTYQHCRSKHACCYQNMKSSHNRATRTSRKEAGSEGNRGRSFTQEIPGCFLTKYEAQLTFDLVLISSFHHI
ncbi:unnamed protein product [Pleuronectes platessa]|uniref:Uncharacterized protein n=1 Tax=Pleuronectes platessa TaxID=8262 RepID=A0A9N7VPJ3_PLEPL|nr:unnamed protein product [Pleuronectes platessa]